MRPRRSVGRACPELAELVTLLESHGVEHGGAIDIVQAVAAGADWYVEALVNDAAAWRRFKTAFEVVSGTGTGEVSPDSITVGALAWCVLRGAVFTRAVADQLLAEGRKARNATTGDAS